MIYFSKFKEYASQRIIRKFEYYLNKSPFLIVINQTLFIFEKISESFLHIELFLNIAYNEM